MDKLNFKAWYEELKTEAPKYGFSNDLIEKISQVRWERYFYKGSSPAGALCEYSFEATGLT